MYNKIAVVLLIVAFMGYYSYRTAEKTRAAILTDVLAPQLIVPNVIGTAIYASLNSAKHIISLYYNAILVEVRQFRRNINKSKIIGKFSIRGP